MIALCCGGTQFLKVDVTDEGDIEGMVAAAVDAYGELDAAFNSAAVSTSSTPLVELCLEPRDLDR